MAIDLDFRRRAVRTLTNLIGCYALCDLDGVPIYVGHIGRWNTFTSQ
jgi:hypothetical protein